MREKLPFSCRNFSDNGEKRKMGSPFINADGISGYSSADYKRLFIGV
jgi:hypothetical protein